MKQLVILVFYINVGNSSTMRVREQLTQVSGTLNKTFSEDVQNETNTIIKTIILPVKDQNTYVECIFPTVEDLPEEIAERLEQIELTQKEYLC